MKTQPLNDLLYFIKSDRRAIVALGCIGVFCVGVLIVVDRVASTQPSPSKDTMQVADKPNILPKEGKAFEGQKLSSFDPNTVDSLTLISYGIQPWKVRNFLHYRAAGKVFRSAEEMGNTYGWTENDVATLKPHVRVGEQYRKDGKRCEKQESWERKEERSERTSNKFQSLTKVDINTADTAQLRRIPGVGENISLAIVRYRQRLGGFHSVNQLLEISIVSPELLDWMEVSSSPNLQKLNINKASFQALNSHPYISYEQTKALLQYIRLYGNVKDEETLLATGIFTAEDIEKLRPYITYE